MNRRPFAVVMPAIFAALVMVACGGSTAEEPPVTTATATANLSPSATPPPPTVAPTTVPSPTPPPTAAPTETAPPSTEEPTATPESRFLTIPAVNCCRGRTLEAGHYAVPPWLDIPLAIDLGEGWRVLNEERAQLLLIGRGENVQNNPSQIITFINATSDTNTPESLIAAVQAAPELVVLAEPVPVTIAGFSGLQLDSAAKPNPTEKGSPADDIPPGIQFLPVFRQHFAPGFLWTTSSPEARVRTIALSVGDQVLLLYMEAPPDEFETFAVDADALLQSLVLIE